MTPILMKEQNPVAHRPDLSPHQQYVQWTQHHQHQAQGLPPCAVHLWQYLLYKYPGGVPQEINLEEIRFEISQGRSKTYCVQSLKNALWKHLIPRGLVAVVKEFTKDDDRNKVQAVNQDLSTPTSIFNTRPGLYLSHNSKRIMRVVANHAGPVKQIENRFGQAQSNLQVPKLLCETEPETIELADSIQSCSNHTQSLLEQERCSDAELEEIRAAIADAPFTQAQSEQSASTVEPPVESKFSAPVASILERLRLLEIPLSEEVRSLVAKTPEQRLEPLVSALEEAAATKGLKSPIAAFKYFVTNNCQPRLDSRQSWWNSAATALGQQRRDQLIQGVTQYAGEFVVMFTNGRRLSLAQAQELSWEAIALVGTQGSAALEDEPLAPPYST